MNDIRLLLVDDEQDFRAVIARRLGKRGLAAAQAASGNECLTFLDEKPVDVVLLDVKMPGLNGIEVLRQIKQKHPETEVILLTGHASPQDGVDGIKAGAFDYLTKPIEFEHLVSKIHQAAEKIRRAVERRQEAAFREKMHQRMIAAERLASLGTLAAGVAHEINNPLAIINESAGWMKQLLAKDVLASMPHRPEFEKALSKIAGAVNRAKIITHQLLGFVRKRDAASAEVHLDELIDETLSLVAREIEAKHIEVVRHTDPGIVGIWSDPYQLRQVLINLITNAIHASADQGRIFITIQVTDPGIALTVRDTGVGIPPEQLELIFEPFFSTKAPDKGTGLGLFVSRGIVEKLGGTINVESRLGSGASFCVRLPSLYKNEPELPDDRILDMLGPMKGGT